MARAPHCWCLQKGSPCHHITNPKGTAAPLEQEKREQHRSPPHGQRGAALHNGTGDGSLPSSAVKGNDHIKKGNPLNINTRIILHIIQGTCDSSLAAIVSHSCKRCSLRALPKEAQAVCKDCGTILRLGFHHEAVVSVISTKFINNQVEMCMWVTITFLRRHLGLPVIH